MNEGLMGRTMQPRGTLVHETPPVKRGVIECELNDLAATAQELEAAVEQLIQRLLPVIDTREGVKPSDPEPPEPTLPELGERIRGPRKSVMRNCAVLRSLLGRIEL